MDKLMSQKEVKKAQVLELLKDKKISQEEAAKRLDITTRQVRRLSKRYRAVGMDGLISRKRGSASNRRLDDTIRTTAINLIGTHYRDFGPTLACEKLVELHDLQVSIETTRQLMIGAGYWHPKKGGTICAHPMRERRARFGELIQIDGNPHDWFEGRGEYCTLLVFIDDATGRLTQLRFAPTETTLGYCGCCTITFWRTGCRWRYTATNTASSASMPKRLIQRPKRNSRGRHASWESNAFMLTARKPRGAWNGSIRPCRID